MKTIKRIDIKVGDVVIDIEVSKQVIIVDECYNYAAKLFGSIIDTDKKLAILDGSAFLTSDKVVKIEPKDDYIKDIVRFIFEKSNR
jgi:hypothetical protein